MLKISRDLFIHSPVLYIDIYIYITGISKSVSKLAAKRTISSRSEQTFNRAWNQCPSSRWTQWLKITGSFMQQRCKLIMTLSRGILFSVTEYLKETLRRHALFIETIVFLLKHWTTDRFWIFQLVKGRKHNRNKMWLNACMLYGPIPK